MTLVSDRLIIDAQQLQRLQGPGEVWGLCCHKGAELGTPEKEKSQTTAVWPPKDWRDWKGQRSTIELDLLMFIIIFIPICLNFRFAMIRLRLPVVTPAEVRRESWRSVRGWVVEPARSRLVATGRMRSLGDSTWRSIVPIQVPIQKMEIFLSLDNGFGNVWNLDNYLLFFNRSMSGQVSGNVKPNGL